jgi:hypothetical protein
MLRGADEFFGILVNDAEVQTVMTGGNTSLHECASQTTPQNAPELSHAASDTPSECSHIPDDFMQVGTPLKRCNHDGITPSTRCTQSPLDETQSPVQPATEVSLDTLTTETSEDPSFAEFAAGLAADRQPQASTWRVSYKEGGVRIRANKDSHAEVLGIVRIGKDLEGHAEGCWLRLSEQPGYVRIHDDDGIELLQRVKVEPDQVQPALSR